MIEILTALGSHTIEPIRTPGADQPWISRAAFEAATGSRLEPEGLCTVELRTPGPGCHARVAESVAAGKRDDPASAMPGMEDIHTRK